MGRITLFTGRGGCGKSRLLQSLAKELLDKGERVLYLVPEQFTFETERALSQTLGGGLLDVTVCSFTSLARRVLKETGERRVFLSRQGRRMVIRKCAEEHAASLTAFARVAGRAGFTEECDSFFTQLKRFGVGPERLAAASQALPPHTQLHDKLHDLALLYDAVESHLAGRSMDAEDAFEALRLRLPGSEAALCHVLVDGFDLVSERLYGVIATLAALCPSMTVALRGDDSPRCRDRAVFAAEARVAKRIEAIAHESGIPFSRVELPPAGEDGATPSRKAPALLHLEREGFAYPPRPYEGTDGPDSLELFAGTDVRAEAEAVADAVLRMADAGVRYRDMAVIAADMELYIEPVGRALRARGVPFFTDAKQPLAQYPAARLTVSALKAATRGFPREELVRIVKTGLAGVSEEDGELFENFVTARGVRGAGFKAPFPEDAPKGAERARAALMGPLLSLASALQNAPAAREKAAALYGYYVSVGLREALVDLTDELRTGGRFQAMEETAQVFNMLLELISQLHAILGEAKISNGRFLAVLEEGLSTYEVGVIPTTADQLLFGSLGRSRARDLDALFVLGAANGVFPAAVGDDGMIDDEELARLEGLGVTGLPTTLQRTDKELADVYGAVTKPRRRLYLSYTMGAGADARLPCELMERILSLFPGMKMNTNVTGELAPASEESAFHALVAGLRRAVDSGEADAQTRRLYRAFSTRSGPYRERLAQVEEALFPSISPEPFGAELARILYGAPFQGGPTQLETFNTCPFRHFARYGLKLLPRREFRERKMDEGLFCHEALSRFTKELLALNRDAADVTEREVEALLDRILPPLIRDHNHGVLLDTARNRAACARLVRRVKLTAWAVVRQLALGEFRLEGSEVEFGPGKPYPAIELALLNGERFTLSGRIDRIDGYTDPASAHYARVVDYKSRAGSDFDCKDLMDGVKLQLPLYLAAVAAAGELESAPRAPHSRNTAHAAGMFYLPVQEAAVGESELAGQKTLEERLLAQFRLRGAALADELIVRAGGGGAVLPGTASGWRLSRAELTAVQDFALDKAQQTAQAVARGEAEALPYRNKSGRAACSLCDYASVCGFDPMLPGCAYRNASRIKTDEFIEEALHAKLDD